jgi:hypothetical protein
MIPKEFHDLPVHPLLVHATVVLIPLALLLVVLFVIPRTRAWAALPMALLSVAALVSTILSRASGFNLKHHLVGTLGPGASANPYQRTLTEDIDRHQSLANNLFYLMIPFAIVAVVAYLMWLQPSWWPVRVPFTGFVDYITCAVVLVLALIVAIQVARVGEAGSKIVYNPDGSQNFNSAPVISIR